MFVAAISEAVIEPIDVVTSSPSSSYILTVI